MLRVQVTYEKENIANVVFQDHAMYDDYGKDIVCAAASSIFITTVNAISSFDTSYIEVEESKDKVIMNILNQNEITMTLCKNMVSLLNDLEKQYPKNIKIN